MTPEHIYIAIGAALFALLLVAWLWGRRGKKFPAAYPRGCQGWRLHDHNGRWQEDTCVIENRADA